VEGIAGFRFVHQSIKCNLDATARFCGQLADMSARLCSSSGLAFDRAGTRFDGARSRPAFGRAPAAGGLGPAGRRRDRRRRGLAFQQCPTRGENSSAGEAGVRQQVLRSLKGAGRVVRPHDELRLKYVGPISVDRRRIHCRPDDVGPGAACRLDLLADASDICPCGKSGHRAFRSNLEWFAGHVHPPDPARQAPGGAG